MKTSRRQDFKGEILASVTEGDFTPDFHEVKISFRAARERVCNVFLHMTHTLPRFSYQ